MKTYGTKLIVSVVALVALVGGIFAFVARSGGKSDTSVALGDTTGQTNPTSAPLETTNPNASAGTPADVPSATRSTKYKDGTYSAVGTYNSPGGSDDLNVTLTIKNDVVTDAAVTSGAHDPRSARYQSMFIGGYKAYVIGKSIDSINLDVVSGSSLTPIGFNNALAKIKTEAKA